MENTFEYISIHNILDRLLRHPLLKDVTIELAIYYIVDFLGIVGMPKLYETREDEVEIKEYRGMTPCELISINGIMKLPEMILLRAMSNIFNPKDIHKYHSHGYDTMNHCHHHTHHEGDELTFKCLGNVIFTGFKHGKILVNYNTIKLDEEGMPMIINEPNFIKALELYIKNEVFNILFDEGKIDLRVLLNTQLQYSWAVGRFLSKWNLPSYAEMESIKNQWCAAILNNNKFYDGFKSMSRPQILIRH